MAVFDDDIPDQDEREISVDCLIFSRPEYSKGKAIRIQVEEVCHSARVHTSCYLGSSNATHALGALKSTLQATAHLVQAAPFHADGVEHGLGYAAECYKALRANQYPGSEARLEWVHQQLPARDRRFGSLGSEGGYQYYAVPSFSDAHFPSVAVSHSEQISETFRKGTLSLNSSDHKKMAALEAYADEFVQIMERGEYGKLQGWAKSWCQLERKIEGSLSCIPPAQRAAAQAAHAWVARYVGEPLKRAWGA